MATFKGQAEYSVDSKGRVAIPAKMRSCMSPEAKNAFVITRGFDHCIMLYPQDKWADIEAQISELSNYDREARAFSRMFLMFAEDVPLDGQGRVSLTKSLLEYANVTEKALIIGALDHLEIWDPDGFSDYLDRQATDFETLAELVMKPR